MSPRNPGTQCRPIALREAGYDGVKHVTADVKALIHRPDTTVRQECVFNALHVAAGEEWQILRLLKTCLPFPIPIPAARLGTCHWTRPSHETMFRKRRHDHRPGPFSARARDGKFWPRCPAPPVCVFFVGVKPKTKASFGRHPDHPRMETNAPESDRH